MKKCCRFAVNRLHLPNGDVLFNQVLEVQDGRILAFYPLTEELPDTEWLGGDYYLPLRKN